ncbi:type IIL restriction-modification enzyme MmeI [Corynebacterium sp. HMSC28B08]|uniref:type IIL restriction-modification enzyme MmeI n=1 Tax=Corynebacterium TaxID=1716 RepID=UPI001AF0156B|nr:type IIL restriction-modification enzyme MmeI [Corynebacterium sp. HMSC28B08]
MTKSPVGTQKVKIFSLAEMVALHLLRPPLFRGQAVATLFAPLFELGWRIRFAHRTFSWDSEAPGKAAVHCVIVGFDRENKSTPQLWDYPDIKGEPAAVSVEKGINGYLVDGENVLIETRSSVLSPELAPVRFGSMPNDKGFLVPKTGTERPYRDPIAMKYVRPFVGAQELLHGEDRWCYWMADDSFSPEDIKKSAEKPESKVFALQGCRVKG